MRSTAPRTRRSAATSRTSGHSEGAVLATALAARGVPLAGVVLLAGTARGGEEVLRWQADRLASTLPAPVRWVLRLMRTDLPTQVRKNHAKIKATTTDVARVGLARINARWHREFMAYDPGPDLRALGVPVLALTGSKDLQAPPEDLEAIARLVPRDVQTALVPDLSHILRTQVGAPSVNAYRADARRPVEPRVLDLVVSWVRRVTAVSDEVPQDAAPGVAGG
ncbi:alpha/beta hydrolase [Georgenia sp. 10Sc9-8]|uniref:Alpha/beta hydrolase n=1 Tax=Georgenia halotolerans TaxID=3028317 RepID=A0ABT5U3X7_9MICO|nr:alpha/beta hydrolase [Georgenia halotolerans]